MGAYDTDMEECPYCGFLCDADFVDVGVGMVRCGPYHCDKCGASEIGPEFYDWWFKDRSGQSIMLPSKKAYHPVLKKRIQLGCKYVLKPGHPFSEEEIRTGWYKGRHKVSPYANTIDGIIVNHKVAKKAYDLGILDEKRIGE